MATCVQLFSFLFVEEGEIQDNDSTAVVISDDEDDLDPLICNIPAGLPCYRTLDEFTRERHRCLTHPVYSDDIHHRYVCNR